MLLKINLISNYLSPSNRLSSFLTGLYAGDVSNRSAQSIVINGALDLVKISPDISNQKAGGSNVPAPIAIMPFKASAFIVQ